jgi:hypothetical protein
MKKYYINGAANESDAFSIEDLQTKGLKATDYIWFEGLTDWTPVTSVEELVPFLSVSDTITEIETKTSSTIIPPPFNKDHMRIACNKMNGLID